jgi:hypothetical protein
MLSWIQDQSERISPRSLQPGPLTHKASSTMKNPVRFVLALITLGALWAAVGCNTSSKKKDYDTMVARFLIEASEREAFATVTLPISGVQIAVNSKPVVTEFDYTGVSLAQSDLGKFLVFNLTADAARDVYRVTGNNQGKRLVLFINDKPVGARVIDGAFNTGSIAVFPALPDEMLPELVKNLDGTSVELQKKVAKEKS